MAYQMCNDRPDSLHALTAVTSTVQCFLYLNNQIVNENVRKVNPEIRFSILAGKQMIFYDLM